MGRARSAWPGAAVAVVVLLLGVLFAFAQGRYPVSLAELAQLTWGQLAGRSSGLPVNLETIVWQVRGPRVLAALAVGAALAVAGTAFQGLFRNPLVSPDILGASAGAALGAVLGIFFSLGILGIQASAFAAGCWRWASSICWAPHCVPVSRCSCCCSRGWWWARCWAPASAW